MTSSAPSASSVPDLTSGRARRRQRSTRLTTAAGLVGVSALLVVGAALTGAWVAVLLAAVLSVVLGAAAVRIMQTEVGDARRDAARERAQLARDYRGLAADRAEATAATLQVLTGRLADREQTVHEMTSLLAQAQAEVASTKRDLAERTSRCTELDEEQRVLSRSLDSAEDRATEAIVRLAELEQERDLLRAELTAMTQAWRGAEARRGA